MHTEVSIDMQADPRDIYQLAGDISRWPALLPHYRKVTVHSLIRGRRRATMSAVRRFGPLSIPVWWRSEQWSDDADPRDLQLRFHHVGGATRGMDVVWHIRPTQTGSHVSIEHDFRRALPLLGDQAFPRIVDRLFVRPIATQTLATFKSLAEARTGIGATARAARA
jgi:ribosome-associated toxin RatA of RatAB toxin-antitoxin module